MKKVEPYRIIDMSKKIGFKKKRKKNHEHEIRKEKNNTSEHCLISIKKIPKIILWKYVRSSKQADSYISYSQI